MKAAKRFLGKALKSLKNGPFPKSINTDKAPFYIKAISQLKGDGVCHPGTKHTQIKYLNNIVESDHGKLKRLIKPTLGFKSLKTAYATIKGFEIMRMFKKGQFNKWMRERTPQEETRLVNELFDIYSA